MTESSIELQLARARELAAKRRNQPLPTVVENEDDDEPPYTSFTGTPVREGVSLDPNVNSDDMEATVASLVYESTYGDSEAAARGSRSGVTGWFSHHGKLPTGAKREPGGRYSIEATLADLIAVTKRDDVDRATRQTVLSVLAFSPVDVGQFSFRADSEGAPETHAEAVRRGEP